VRVRYSDGIVSPAAWGYESYAVCAMLGRPWTNEDIEPYLEDIDRQLFKMCPSGVGEDGSVRL
jgi:RNA-splicing ligase RtcB